MEFLKLNHRNISTPLEFFSIWRPLVYGHATKLVGVGAKS